jgi:DNA-binding CsgD family transcriptional regulator
MWQWGLSVRGLPVGSVRLIGRVPERAALGGVLDAARAGHSAVLVIRGEPGIGKTALLDYAIESGTGLRITRVAGIESEMELAFAALHQLCAPMLNRMDHLPGPQREALGVAFGLRAGAAPDRFLVSLAALSLLSDAADEQPLLCVVDDAQWLDRASAQVLGFVARRLLAEPVALLIAARELEEDFTGLPELVVLGLNERDARELSRSVACGPLDERVRERLVAETRGNPLAMLELPRELMLAEQPGLTGVADPPGLSDRIEDNFRRRLETLPADTRQLLLVAAAEPAGEPLLLWRAASRLGIAVDAADAAETAGLLAISDRVTFRHPLVRSAAYRAASPMARRMVHGALAEVTDPETDADRRAWHRAQATAGADEEVAADLERSAGRAHARGGCAAAAAFLKRSASLTLDPVLRAERSLAAADATYHSGAFDVALGLVAAAEAGPLDDLQRARLDLLHARIAFASNHGRDAPPLLLKAARQFEGLDVRLARDTYLEALSAALFASWLTRVGIPEIAEAARLVPTPQPPRAPDLLLDGTALLITEGYPAGAPVLKAAVKAFREEEISDDKGLHWLWQACGAAGLMWDYESWDELSARLVTLIREAGALMVLPVAFSTRAGVLMFAGDFAGAGALVAEVRSATEATRSNIAPYAGLTLAVLQGRVDEAFQIIEVGSKDVVSRGEGEGICLVRWATAVLCNSVGRYEEALEAAQQASEDSPAILFSNWAVVELVEAATRCRMPERAATALDRLSESTRASGTDWALGVGARSRALVSGGADAEPSYREAIERLARTPLRVELGRAHLLYGEWLRRRRRMHDARDELHAAHAIFDSIGAASFAERTRAELRATGEHVRKRRVDTRAELTPQEALIARLAGDGASNPQIAAQLFISRATVAYHLRKVFAKLDVSSRHQLTRGVAAQQVTPPVSPAS